MRKSVKYFVLFVVWGLIDSCINNQPLSQWSSEERGNIAVFLHDSDERIDDALWNSDFCAIATVWVKNIKRDLPPKGDQYEIDGEFEIESLVYGNPQRQRIPFSTVQYDTKISSFGAEGRTIEESFVLEQGNWQGFPPNQGDTLILLGKGTGEASTILKTIKRKDLDNIKLTTEYLRLVKHLGNLPEKERQKLQEKLLLESDHFEVLGYLFRQSYQKGGLEQQISTIESIFSKGEITLERKFIACQLAIHMLYPPGLPGGPIYPYYAHYLNISSSQRQRLRNIIIKCFSNVKTVQESFIYSCELSPYFLQADKVIGDSLRETINDLSKNFAQDQNYPEWEKWVKKMFPDD